MRRSIKKQARQPQESRIVNPAPRPFDCPDGGISGPDLEQLWEQGMGGVPMLNPEELHGKITDGEGHEYTVRSIGESRTRWVVSVQSRSNIVSKILTYLRTVVGKYPLVTRRRR